jgi:hypothetical protein
MATIALPERRRAVGRFYVGMAWLFVAIAFGGFFETYWLQVARGTFNGPPLLHLHGLLFSLWTLFFLSQATLVANGRLRSHRSLGMLGISLATAMLFVGFAVAIEGLRSRIAAGIEPAASRAFTLVPITAVLLFAGFVAAAIANYRRPEWHKRFMLAATATVLQAAIARFFFIAATGGGPGARPGLGPPPPDAMVFMGAGLAELLVVIAMVHDWRSNARVHPAYWWAFSVGTIAIVVRPLIAHTGAWMQATDSLLAF